MSVDYAKTTGTAKERRTLRARQCPHRIWLRATATVPGGPRLTTNPGPDGLYSRLDADPSLALAPIACNCKRHICPACGPRRRQEIRKHMKSGFDTGDPVRFLTVTCAPDAELLYSSDADWTTFNRKLGELIAAVRHSGIPIQYCRVIEGTKRGILHGHFLTTGLYIRKCTDKGRRKRGLPVGTGSGSPCYCDDDLPCVQKLAHRLGLGWVDVKLVDSPEKAMQYMMPYLSKAGASTDRPKGRQWYSYSHGWGDGRTLAAIHREYLSACRARWGNRHNDFLPPGVEIVSWQIITDPYHLARVIWKHGPPPRPPPAPPDPFVPHLAGRIWNPDTGEVFPMPPASRKPHYTR